MNRALGLDTSNYTTSAAVFSPGGPCRNAGKLLTVPSGAMGLRQSEAVFQHVRHLPEQMEFLRRGEMLREIAVVGASTAPREAEGSYMPCFLVGESQGKALAAALDVPFFGFSHQQGHVAAGCWSAGRLELLDEPLLCWHLSGGTTELLLAEPRNGVPHMTILGGTEDLSAGQLIDRTGKRLNVPFPSGKGLDGLAQQSGSSDCFPVRLRGLHFSLSGVENQVQKRVDAGVSPPDVARFTLNTVTQLVRRVTDAALREFTGLPVLCVGGVAANTLLRRVMCDAVFAAPEFSADNAMGIAVLAYRMLERGETN